MELFRCFVTPGTGCEVTKRNKRVQFVLVSSGKAGQSPLCPLQTLSSSVAKRRKAGGKTCLQSLGKHLTAQTRFSHPLVLLHKRACIQTHYGYTPHNALTHMNPEKHTDHDLSGRGRGPTTRGTDAPRADFTTTTKSLQNKPFQDFSRLKSRSKHFETNHNLGGSGSGTEQEQNINL